MLRKKKRLNARRFVSRYSASDFCTDSSILFPSANCSSSFWPAHIVSTCGVFFACPSVLRQNRSTFMKRLLSSGSCSWMSGASKMGERYIHERCTASHSSRISDTRFSCFSHSLMRCSKGFLNGENVIDCVITMWSSSCCVVCSSTLMTYVPVSRYSMTPSSQLAHSPCILSSAVSMLYSLPATSEIFVMSSMCSWRPISIAFDSVKDSSGNTVMPSSEEIFSQCLSRMPGFRMAWISGTYGLNSSISSRMFSQHAAHLGRSRTLKPLPCLKTVRHQFCTFLSISSASSVTNESSM